MRRFDFSAWVFLCLFLTMLVPGPARAEEENGYLVARPDFLLPKLEAQLSADGLTLANAVPALVLVADPNPQMQGQRSLGRTADDALAAPDAAISTFNITYLAAGQRDLWGQPCTSFPEEAKAAFQAAAAIWQSRVRSSVPITINACWSNLGSSSILGYSGGQPSRRNFTGAPKADTWYQQSLANALAGVNLGTNPDMHITYNSEFTWYYGTDGNTPYGQYDLVTVATHEIAHGLNFSGSGSYAGGTGSYGYETGYPSVYDTFMQSGSGTPLISYPNPSTSLGALLTSGNLWFNGPNANAANGGTRVKMYAPGSWSAGSSYSHLDYASYASTANRMMVYSIGSATSSHDPGPVALGILKDLGWSSESGFTWSGVVRAGSSNGAPLAGATVAIGDRTATTSSAGTFSVTGIPAGRYTLTISKEGYYTKTMTGIAVFANRSELVLYLTPMQTFTWSGTLRSGSATGPVLAGATVKIGNRSAQSSSTGSYSVSAIPYGTYTLEVSKAGYYTKTMTGIAVKANRSGLVLYLTPMQTYTWSGTVRSGSASGPLLSGATVKIGTSSALTSSTGSYSISGIPAGTYTVEISKDGYNTRSLTGIAVTYNRSGLVLCLTPVPLYSLSGTVRSGSALGPALAGATVSIAGKSVTTGSTGTFSITGIPAGSYTLTISKSGFATKTVTGYAISSNQSSLFFYLVQSVSYGSIRVVNGSGSLPIVELFISPSSSPDWGPDQLPSAIPPGYALLVNQVPPDSYDLKAKFSDGQTVNFYYNWGFPVAAGMTTVMTAVPGASGAVHLQTPSGSEPESAQVPLRHGTGAPKR